MNDMHVSQAPMPLMNGMDNDVQLNKSFMQKLGDTMMSPIRGVEEQVFISRIDKSKSDLNKTIKKETSSTAENTPNITIAYQKHFSNIVEIHNKSKSEIVKDIVLKEIKAHIDEEESKANDSIFLSVFNNPLQREAYAKSKSNRINHLQLIKLEINITGSNFFERCDNISKNLRAQN